MHTCTTKFPGNLNQPQNTYSSEKGPPVDVRLCGAALHGRLLHGGGGRGQAERRDEPDSRARLLLPHILAFISLWRIMLREIINFVFQDADVLRTDLRRSPFRVEE